MKTAVKECAKRYAEGDFGYAFTRIGKMNNTHILTREEKKTLVVAGEMLTLGSSIYEQMGWDREETIAKAHEIFTRTTKK